MTTKTKAPTVRAVEGPGTTEMMKKSGGPSASAQAAHENVLRLALSPHEAAIAIGVSVSWLAKMRCKGDGPAFITLGASPTSRRVAYRVEALNEYLDSRPTHRSTSDGRPAAPVGVGRPKGARKTGATR